MIVQEGSSYRIERDEFGDRLVVTDAWNDEINRILADGLVTGLDLNYAKGFKNTDLAVVRPWPLKRLWILARTIKDLTPIATLAGTLEFLSVDSAPSAQLDLGIFEVLTGVAADWSQISASLSDAPWLRDVMVTSYGEPDLTPFRWNTELRRLRFKDRPRLRSLDGVEALHALEHLGVYLAPLKDLSALATEDLRLRELHIESCPVLDLSPLASQRNLTLLNASDCGNIASLEPLRGLIDLAILWLFGTTRVVDDDLSPLCDLPRLGELRMRSRRSYHPTVEAIQALCAERRLP